MNMKRITWENESNNKTMMPLPHSTVCPPHLANSDLLLISWLNIICSKMFSPHLHLISPLPSTKALSTVISQHSFLSWAMFVIFLIICLVSVFPPVLRTPVRSRSWQICIWYFIINTKYNGPWNNKWWKILYGKGEQMSEWGSSHGPWKNS